ncbi:MAG: hypothetical protein K0R65_1093 [Crocinitomicaceae bacterium]|jgi:hypothetical protein|nr:hypothetical protein [Crocinitomicaceae bacterium]
MEPNKDILKHIKAKQKPAVDPAYFEQFQAKMMEEIKKQPKAKVIYMKPLFWLSGAAAVALIIFGISMFSNGPETNFASVSQEEIEHYLDETQDEKAWEVIEDEPEEKTELVSPGKNENPKVEAEDKNIEIASTEDFVSSAQLLEEITTDDIYQYIESEEFDLEELEYSQF